ncbi:CaiB/BaiF CoA transferase family protein [Pseudonocardia parietis]|uniref:Crotonobetainyl-CoA:carnitine CoA-transferase CaiB-like acyl-CoA transferase n=1 Tax=Pseudonocardia parietis TaxID=570936 RepID=A0ABS4W6R3_9PSEU|nr:CoA transferase [Pseudonocardia parietis]MBP2371618.1 crotonobetainyl-CoA:carnitine CoA-transferase CaiB-like acyl-CoA transferase [Pseudonocardia parietis]
MGALDGIRVVDLTRYLSGPTLTMLLADMGADVVKVETLPTGDPARQSGPFQDAESVYYMASNRNKRSVALDLRSDEGAAALRRLIAEADVFVQNFKPGTVEKMGVGPEAMRELNPRLVYVSLSGFGQRAPGSELAGFDQTAQAMSGLMSVTGTEETGPLRVGIAVADSATGVFGAVGVLSALYERERTGRGTVVEGSLMQSMLTLLSYQAQKYLSLGVTPGQDGNDHPIMFPQGTFKTRDGAMTLACGNEKMWQRLCGVLGTREWENDSRFASNADRMDNRTELRKLIEEVLATRTTEEWLEIVGAGAVPCGPVLTIPEALEHPITAGLDMVAEVDHSTLGTMKVLGQSVNIGDPDPEWLHRPAPMLGEHTEEVLTGAGYSADEVDLMVVAGHAAQWRKAGG